MAEAIEFSLVRGDLPARLQCRFGMIPAAGLGSVRRALFLAALTWLPIAVDVWSQGEGGAQLILHSALYHLPVHVRCLVAIPLFVGCDASADLVSRRFFAQLLKAELVGPAELPALYAIIRTAKQVRDSRLPWLLIGGLGIAWLVRAEATDEVRELLRMERSGARAAFAAFWYVYLARPLFAVMLLGWLWRIALWTWIMIRIARLPLSLVPTHPDRACGLGELERLPAAFAPLMLGVSSVVAAVWGHNVSCHGVSLASLRAPAAISAALLSAIVLLPVCVFAPSLARAKLRALRDYGALLAHHGRLVRERWILGHEVGEPRILDAPELGPVADTNSLFEAVARTRVVPIGRATVALIAIPLGLPVLVLLAFQLPLAPLVAKLAAALL